jgi:phosphoribosylanthranilate isomerase
MHKPTHTIPFIVKICGITLCEDAQAAIDAGANALGFNFYPKSPRYLSVDQMADITSNLSGDYLRVGIFVNPSPEELQAADPFLDVAQVYGSAKSVLPTWRALNAGTFPEPDPSIDAWLLDSFTPAFGGSGNTFDWSLAARFPYRAIVAGGLDSMNVADAIRIAKPWGVDSCSRLEYAPGRKDHGRMVTFIHKAVEAFQAIQVVNT